ncbi:hypothetical protein Tco_1567052 [Tanacetum coccineum]
MSQFPLLFTAVLLGMVFRLHYEERQNCENESHRVSQALDIVSADEGQCNSTAKRSFSQTLSTQWPFSIREVLQQLNSTDGNLLDMFHKWSSSFNNSSRKRSFGKEIILDFENSAVHNHRGSKQQ